MLSAKLLWDNAKSELEKDMTSISFNTWMRDIVPVSVDGDSLVLQTGRDGTRLTLAGLYGDMVTTAVRTANELETPISVKFIDPSERRAVEEESAKAESSLNRRYTFDTFVVGDSNNFAFGCAVGVANNPASSSNNPLFVYGGVGLGKTHLVQAIGNRIKAVDPDKRIVYISCETFVNELITSLQEQKQSAFRAKYRSADVLIVDDIQFLVGKEACQNEFFHTFNTLRDSDRKIILTSDKPPRELIGLPQRLTSRFEWGLIVDIQPPSFETRMAILKNKAQLDNLSVRDDVLSFIAENASGNIRELEGSLNRIAHYASLTSRPITLELAKTALRDLVAEKKAVTPEFIQQVVADYYQINIADLSSQRRDKKFAFPRQVAMYLMRELTTLSLQNIGDIFGGKHYTTVKSNVERIEERLAVDGEFVSVIDTLSKRIKNQ